jgi:hypothetical protein
VLAALSVQAKEENDNAIQVGKTKKISVRQEAKAS